MCLGQFLKYMKKIYHFALKYVKIFKRNLNDKPCIKVQMKIGVFLSLSTLVF